MPVELPTPPSDTSTALALWSARTELVIILARIRKALNALPKNPDAITLRRWNYCIGRETVSLNL